MASDTHSPTQDSYWHGQRFRLNAELHARPFLKVEAPARLLHFACPHGGSATADRYIQLIRMLMTASNQEEKSEQINASEQISIHYGDVQVKYQKHTEFSSLTLLVHGTTQELFEDVFTSKLPEHWLNEVEKGAITASRLSLENRSSISDDDYHALPQHWIGSPIARNMVLNNGAETWTDFRIYPDGYSRFLLIDHGMREQQAGRLTQRLFEIETYTMAALLALPMARESMNDLLSYECSLAHITEEFTDQTSPEDHRRLLTCLSQLAGKVEKQIATFHFRFSATQAYNKMIEQRITELREERIEGYVQLREFMERRLAPAINLCSAAMLRQENLSKRLARASQLLRTSVDISMQAQNRKLLASMDNRAQMQFHLQEMVEILSSVAVLYYGFGLVHGALERLEMLGVHINESLLSLASIPILAIALLAFIHTKRKKLHRQQEANSE